MATYVRIARSFLAALSPQPARLRRIVAADVTGFLVAMSVEASAPSLSMTVTAMASLLRYLHVAGVTAAPLARTLPPVARRGIPAVAAARRAGGNAPAGQLRPASSRGPA